MGFADAYLVRAGLREELIENKPRSTLEIIVTIPVYHESGLERCLDSLFKCDTSGIRGEVIVLVNAPADSPAGILEKNRKTYHDVLTLIRSHPHPDLDCHLLLDHTFSNKEAGVGTARKILMDEAVRRFSSLDRPEGIIASMDADAVVEENYLQTLTGFFRKHHPDGCSVYFEHPLSGPGYSEDTYRAVMQYELHQRYYLQSVRSTGYPHAFHTVGSCFAVRADIYCKEGGMNRRKGGEDFYFIQKVAQRGNFRECNGTRVVPSPRPSDRVPFGTGPVVKRLLEYPGSPLFSYDPRPFTMLRKLFDEMEMMYSGVDPNHLKLFAESRGEPSARRSQSSFRKKSQRNPLAHPSLLLDFLADQEFGEALAEMRKHAASPASFRKRFWRWFNMFRILKFIHFARQRGYPDIPVQEAACAFMQQLEASPALLQQIRASSALPQQIAPGGTSSADSTSHPGHPPTGDPGLPPVKTLLDIYRQLDKYACFGI